MLDQDQINLRSTSSCSNIIGYRNRIIQTLLDRQANKWRPKGHDGHRQAIIYISDFKEPLSAHRQSMLKCEKGRGEKNRLVS